MVRCCRQFDVVVYLAPCRNSFSPSFDKFRFLFFLFFCSFLFLLLLFFFFYFVVVVNLAVACRQPSKAFEQSVDSLAADLNNLSGPWDQRLKALEKLQSLIISEDENEWTTEMILRLKLPFKKQVRWLFLIDHSQYSRCFFMFRAPRIPSPFFLVNLICPKRISTIWIQLADLRSSIIREAGKALQIFATVCSYYTKNLIFAS